MQEALLPWYGLLDAMSIGLVTMLGLSKLWATADRRSRPAARLREVWRRPVTGRVFVTAIAMSVFFSVAEDRLDAERDALWHKLDAVVRDVASAANSLRPAHQVAEWASDLTGPGLVCAVLTAGMFLVAARRRRVALVVTGGALGAWLLSAGLKLAFGLQRPGPGTTRYAISGYGFPSAHALVAVVVCGLIAWAAGRETGRSAKRAFWVGAAVLAGLGGASRVVLGTHWLSDVVAGFAIGIAWLSLVTLVGARYGEPEADG